MVLMASQQKLVILGGGESGVGAALLAKAKGFEVFLSDKGILKEKYRLELQENGILFEEGKHSTDRILAAELVIKSPGIPDQSDLIQRLLHQGTPVISEIEFAARYTDAFLIAITGSNGKTTTTLLTYHLLREAGIAVGLAGNIGESFAKQVLLHSYACYVLELSSFQLDSMYSFRADIAILLSITPDHLDRYDYLFQNYVDSKFRILQNQTAESTFIYFQGSDVIRRELSQRQVNARQLPVALEGTCHPGAYLAGGTIRAAPSTDAPVFTIDIASLPLRGPHNAINTMAAILAAQTVGIPAATIREALYTFKNAPHRLEPAGFLDGVQYINDSKATNVDAVFYALGSFESPIVLILGGVDKGNDYDQIRELVHQKVKGIIALGKDNSKLAAYFQSRAPAFFSTDNLDEALLKAKEWALPGEVVLLSPACASFDLFANYEDRGNQFKSRVQHLISSV